MIKIIKTTEEWRKWISKQRYRDLIKIRDSCYNLMKMEAIRREFITLEIIGMLADVELKDRRYINEESK